MYNIEDSMVELKHNAQTSKHKYFFFVLESSVSELPKPFFLNELSLFVFTFTMHNSMNLKID